MELEIMKLKLVRESVVGYEAVNSIDAAMSIFRSMLEEEAQEVFSMIALDTKNNLLGYFEVHRGAIDRSLVSIREVAKRALMVNAKSVIVAHNHPSGNAEPSKNDYEVSKALKEGLEVLEIKLLDHVVIGANGSYASAMY